MKKQDIIYDHKQKIKSFSHELPSLLNNLSYRSVVTNSWFDIQESVLTKTTNNFKPEIIKETSIIKCKKIKFFPTHGQKIILKKWFDSFTDTYNQALCIIRKKYSFIKSPTALKNINIIDSKLRKYKNFMYVRSKMFNKKKRNQLNSMVNNDKKL